MRRVVVIASLGLMAVAGCSTQGTAVVAPSPTSAQPAAPSSDPTSTDAPTPTPIPAAAPSSAVPSGPYEPAPLTGLPVAGEGAWKAVDTADGAPVVWTTRFHPLSSVPSVEVTAAVFDQDKLTAALFNGTKLPGGGPFKNGDRVGTAARSALVLAFNGGFLFKHIDGGYFTEGKVLKPLIDGQATLGVRKDGRLVLGIYGKDMTNDGSWLSLRQNLPPLAVQGKNTMGQYPGTYWGNDFNNVDLNYRSALCNRSDGKMMYLVMGMVRANTLGDELARLGCTLAMELDINGHWPQFVWFEPSSRGHGGALLDPKMWKPERYVTTSEKDFIALFDPAALPAGALYGN